MKSSLKTFYRLSVLTLLLIILPCFALAQQSLTFHISTMDAITPIGPWIFDADNPGFPPGFNDNQALTFAAPPAYPAHLYTYNTIKQGVSTTITCTAENMAMVANTADVAFVFGDHTLGGYVKVNSVSPNANWQVMGQAADVRRYNLGSGVIKHLGVDKLVLNNSDLRIYTPFPSQAQMRAAKPPIFPFAAWVGDVGTGLPATAYGWADIDVAGSDPAWVAAYANAYNQISYIITNVVYAIDFTAGIYSYDLQILPAPNNQINTVSNVDPALPATWHLPLPSQDITFDFSAVTNGGAAANMNKITVNEICTAPDGALPGTIVWSDVKYWEIMSTLGSYTTSITFDVSGLGLFNVTDFRVMKREWFKSDWTIWSDITVLDASHVRANNLTSLGDFAIGSIDDPLPVELSSFSATLNAQNYAILNWTTQSESELTGYHVYRSNEPIQSNSVCITTSLIPAQNISTGADYTFTDNELTEEGTYYYWLESMDISGNSTFFGPISLNFNLHDDGEIVSDPDHLGRSIIKNYPNPFKPSTKISFYLQNQEDASITIFNTRGQVVKQYTAKSYNPGWHEINWQGKDDNGSSLPSGIYLVRLTGKSCNMLNKMIMLK